MTQKPRLRIRVTIRNVKELVGGCLPTGKKTKNAEWLTERLQMEDQPPPLGYRKRSTG